MRCNRRRHSKFTAVNKWVVAFMSLMIVIVAGGAFVNLSLRGRISSLNKDIKKLESEYESLRVDINREQTLWGRCSTPEDLTRALLRIGAKMDPPLAENVVVLDGTRKRPGSASEPTAYASR